MRGFGDDEGEVDRGRMESEVDESLGDVEGVDAFGEVALG